MRAVGGDGSDWLTINELNCGKLNEVLSSTVNRWSDFLCELPYTMGLGAGKGPEVFDFFATYLCKRRIIAGLLLLLFYYNIFFFSLVAVVVVFFYQLNIIKWFQRQCSLLLRPSTRRPALFVVYVNWKSIVMVSPVEPDSYQSDWCDVCAYQSSRYRLIVNWMI